MLYPGGCFGRIGMGGYEEVLFFVRHWEIVRGIQRFDEAQKQRFSFK